LAQLFFFFQGEKAADGVAPIEANKIINNEIIVCYLKIFQRRKNGKEQVK
jgi:hypothetical protein